MQGAVVLDGCGHMWAERDDIETLITLSFLFTGIISSGSKGKQDRDTGEKKKKQNMSDINLGLGTFSMAFVSLR